MNNLTVLTDHLVLDQQEYLREARERSLAREAKAARTPKAKANKVRRHRAGRLVHRFAA